MLELYTSGVPSNLRDLNLDSAGIHVPTYNASNLIRMFPKLHLLHLNENALEKLPTFGSSENQTSGITAMLLNKNQIKTISDEDGEQFCKVMHSLTRLKIEQNQLIDITGLRYCQTLNLVSLAENLIGKNQQSNFQTLGKLRKLDHLDLSSNKIKYLSPDLFSNLALLHTLILADNEIYSLADMTFHNTPHLKYLDLSANALPVFNSTVVSHGLSELRTLYLQSNQISTLSVHLLNTVDTWLTKLEYFGLLGNPLTCYCDNYFAEWIRNSTIIPDVKYLNCSTPDNPDVTTPVISFVPNHFRCYVRTPLIVSAIVLSGVVLSLLLGIPCYKYRWFMAHPMVVARAITDRLKEVEFEGKCEYDAFISYDSSSDTDSQWVVDKLIPAIESVSDGQTTTTSDLKLYIVDRNSAIGSLKYTEKCRALEASRKVIILLTNSYLANPGCLSEADLISCYELVDGEQCYQPNRILVLVLEELNEEAIRPPLTSLLTQNVIDIVDGGEKMKRVWRRVRRFIEKPRYTYKNKKRRPSVIREPTERDPLIQ